MKKLFSDPHFNVMDGLDTYIDDYGKPDPLPLVDAAQDGPVGVPRPVPTTKMRQRRREREPRQCGQGMSRWLRPPRRWHSRAVRTAPLATPEPVPMTTLICDCNQTMPLDGPALAPGARA